MPFRRKSRNPVPRPEKENEAMQGAELPLSPRLIRCKSDNTQRTCSEINLNKSLTNHTGGLSGEAKMSNLMQLNGTLIKEVASLRISHSAACNKLAQVESSLRAENAKLQFELASLKEEASSLKEDKTALLASEEQLQSDLCASHAQVESLSRELDMAKSEFAQALLLEKRTLATSQEQLLSANGDIEKLCFNNRKISKEIITLKGDVATLASEKGTLLGEKEEALRCKAEKEAALAASYERENNLNKLLQAEKQSAADVKHTLNSLGISIKQLQDEREQMMQKSLAYEKETYERIRKMEETLRNNSRTVDSLNLQIEEESVKHQTAVTSITEESARKLSEATDKLMAMEDLLQRSNKKADSLSLQIQRERVEHQAESTSLREKLSESTGEVQAIEKQLQQSIHDVDALKKQIKDEAFKHQHEVSTLQEKIAAMVMEVSSFSAENQKLFAKKENLHKELSRVNQKQREASEQLARERKSTAHLQAAEKEVKQLHLEREKTSKEFNLLQDELFQCCNGKEDLLMENQLLSAEKVKLEAYISSLISDQVNLADQRQAEQKANALENQSLLAQLKKAQSAISDLEVEQGELLKQLNTEKMAVAAAQEGISTLESVKQALLDETFEMKSAFSELNVKLQQTLQQMESEMEQLRDENGKLALAKSELLSSNHMYESHGKQLLLEMEKKDEQHAFLSKLLADLETSQSTSESELATQRAACEVLARDNAVLQSSIETKARAIVMLEKQLDDSAKNNLALESQIEVMSGKHHMLELQLKSTQQDLNAQIAALNAEKIDKSSVCGTLEATKIEINELNKQLAEAIDQISMLGNQLAGNLERNSELVSTVEALRDELTASNSRATYIQDQAKANLERMLSEKDDEIAKVMVRLGEISQNKSEVTSKLKACNDKKDQLEVHVRSMENELITAKADVMRAEKELIAAGKFEGEFNEASKRISLLEAQLTAKATMQNDLEFQVISLQNDLHAAQAASAKAEKEWNANMDSMLDNANARSRALEEQLESVKKTLCEMQNNANRGQESIASLQTQLSCLVEEKSSLEKKALSLNPRSLDVEEPSDVEEKGNKPHRARVGLDEKAKLVRLALPVFLISAASSVVIAGIQSYMRGLEN